MTEHRMAGDPLGVSWPVEVPCPECEGEPSCPECGYRNDGDREDWAAGCHYCDGEPCPDCAAKGTIPNPAITQTCEACGGSGVEVLLPEDRHTFIVDCPDCDGLGYTFRKTVRVAERVRVLWQGEFANAPYLRVSQVNVLWFPAPGAPTQDITHLWPEHRQGDFRCLLCGEPWPCSSASDGTIRTFPKPGELWTVGYREAEVLPVVDEFAAPRPARGIVVAHATTVPAHLVALYGPGAKYQDITHHFPDGPPSVGDRAGVLTDLALAEQAVRCGD